jgi:hypothetical protein
MCDNLWIAAATKLHLVRTAAFSYWPHTGEITVTVNRTDAAKTEGGAIQR